jgi:hypothetical protein
MDKKRLEKLADALALAGFEIVSFEPSRTSTTQIIVVLEPEEERGQEE